ncbi:LPS export ABC transporter periplasmic protein LptC [Glaciimonas immobilis]|uniref:Lipopolysaccharide export system protein LptC n=1 Tax=Glaciimonas immobilis TaxID=728004 RepID=A0A840RWZ4_9BURK|nr:LPS export ABC transporter periplasmic protein LptC [Glaciimonas immobilis]KAF3998724.1 LPS export ABC transporter periplasmic protein LptC [Glaciimonas immobilis]MBB5201608.1 lipopolysaccharide export system protein LptC [Glaciimonas immobilis]
MKNLRSTFRLRFMLLLAACVALTLGSFWIMEVMRKNTEQLLPSAPRVAPDYYVENFNYVQLALDGKPRYNISGQRLTHNPADDSFDVNLPVIRSLDKLRPPMTLRSNTAKITDNNSKVDMFGNVNADRLGTPTSSKFHLQTEYLRLLPDDDIMTSDKAVAITIDQSQMNGVGMYANNATQELRLLGNVRGTYRAAIPRKTK